ncbi:hypothetical protein KCTC32516_00567 [Polaribacter huanghezhanensis]|uniref:hypothetical protein n=1 Tax=Polaribacter huanghezhanensis TaxID=1354726 RepID=UPI002649D2D6|nr:hypothetical protein [Polaribacter huanghezhanensis]WKD85227.1 hypothetical protein KCTC32516_00567 [Polaribacter huanghezhanensis]
MGKRTETFIQSDDEKFIFWEDDYFKKVTIGAKFWGWGKRKGECRYYIFWIPGKRGCGECNFK